MDLGTSACPPYHLALVIGGTSASEPATVKASARLPGPTCVTGHQGGARSAT